MVKRRYFMGWVLAALLVALNISAVGATVPDAVNPNLPVAAGAGGGVGVNGGTAGLSRSTIQNPVYTGVNTNVSAIPSANGNETAALYRPGGTYLVTFEETQAQTVSTARYSYGPGVTVSTGIGSAAFSFTGTTTVYGIAATAGRPAFNVIFFGASPGFLIGSSLTTPRTIVLPTAVIGPGQTFGPITTARTLTNASLPAGIYVFGSTGALSNGSSTINFTVGSVLNAAYAGNAQVYDSTGTAVYTTVLVRPPTFNPPNGTSTGEPTAADVVTPFTTTGKISVFIGNGYANPPGVYTGGAPFYSRPPQSQP